MGGDIERNIFWHVSGNLHRWQPALWKQQHDHRGRTSLWHGLDCIERDTTDQLRMKGHPTTGKTCTVRSVHALHLTRIAHVSSYECTSVFRPCTWYTRRCTYISSCFVHTPIYYQDVFAHLLRRQLPLVHDGSGAEAAHVEALRVRDRQHRDRVCLLRGRLNNEPRETQRKKKKQEEFR